ncbi:MAG: hypothetical protein DMG76_00375 [Acidobacteria bacterium]|nr:MAG: hypothetical protein DMG76_00375 [Acidobacteriota bacterium]
MDSNYNLDKHLNPLAEGTAINRHFRAWEWEWYAQDAWRVRPNLTVTYGLRYSLLEPPYETTGTQVQPTTSSHDWFINRGKAADQGQSYFPQIGADGSGNPIYDHNLQFALGGQANHGKPYWNWDYRNLAPRLAIAYSPSGDSGLSHKLWGGPGKSSIRVGYGMYFDHFGEGITSTFDREGAFGLTSSISNPAGIQTTDGAARFTGLNNIPTTSLTTTASCPTAPCSSLQPPGRSLIDILQLARQALVVADVVFAVQIKAGAARAVRCAWPRKCRLTPHSANLYLEGTTRLLQRWPSSTGRGLISRMSLPSRIGRTCSH